MSIALEFHPVCPACAVEALTVICPICSAPSGHPCEDIIDGQLGPASRPHLYRVQVAAEEAAR